MSGTCMVEKAKFLEELVQTGCLKFGKFTLKSGIESDHYVNLREIGEYPDLFRMIVDAIKSLISTKDGDAKLVGVPYGAVAIAGAVAYSSGLPYHFVRKEIKAYGFIAGDNDPKEDNSQYVLIEDVMTTGSSIIETIDKMPGKDVTDVIVVVNRQQGGIENIHKKHPKIRVYSLLNSSEILELHRSVNK